MKGLRPAKDPDAEAKVAAQVPGYMLFLITSSRSKSIRVIHRNCKNK